MIWYMFMGGGGGRRKTYFMTAADYKNIAISGGDSMSEWEAFADQSQYKIFQHKIRQSQLFKYNHIITYST